MHLKIHNRNKKKTKWEENCLQFLSKWIYLFMEWSEDYFVSFAICEIIFYIFIGIGVHIAIKFVGSFFYYFFFSLFHFISFFLLLFFFKFNNVTRLLKTYSLVADKCCIWCVRRLPYFHIILVCIICTFYNKYINTRENNQVFVTKN